MGRGGHPKDRQPIASSMVSRSRVAILRDWWTSHCCLPGPRTMVKDGERKPGMRRSEARSYPSLAARAWRTCEPVAKRYAEQTIHWSENDRAVTATGWVSIETDEPDRSIGRPNALRVWRAEKPLSTKDASTKATSCMYGLLP